MTEKERNELVVNNLNVIHNCLNGYEALRKDRDLYEELFQECCLKFLEKAARYDPERGMISTFIYQIVLSTVNMYFRKQKHSPKTISDNVTIYGSGSDIMTLSESALYTDAGFNVVADYNCKDLLSALNKYRYGNKSTKSQKRDVDFFVRHCVYNEKLEDIADDYGCTRQYISKCISDCKKRLRVVLANYK